MFRSSTFIFNKLSHGVCYDLRASVLGPIKLYKALSQYIYAKCCAESDILIKTEPGNPSYRPKNTLHFTNCFCDILFITSNSILFIWNFLFHIQISVELVPAMIYSLKSTQNQTLSLYKNLNRNLVNSLISFHSSPKLGSIKNPLEMILMFWFINNFRLTNNQVSIFICLQMNCRKIYVVYHIICGSPEIRKLVCKI